MTQGRRSAGRNTQLSAEDWIEVGYTILAEDGLKQIKIDTLCDRIGATRGSFYWHFKDIAAYKHALVTRWGEWNDEEHKNFDELEQLPPRERLLRLITQLTSPRHWMLERAMREWARTDPHAATAVRTSDRRAHHAVRRCLLAHGLDPDTAAVRADWIMAMGIGALHLSTSKEDGAAAAHHGDQLVDMMLDYRTT
ncbi:TetR/AcrR family transcriptional regulator [Nocardia farcinica]|uniref:TetR/AcrR family transcriptional regulator n=1 Tax=Nocardia farcinica TaxID=37329 RepID=UPI0024541988|nr:TetR/AcrR family transcriptional regulator [Nocardia farcinica]